MLDIVAGAWHRNQIQSVLQARARARARMNNKSARNRSEITCLGPWHWRAGSARDAFNKNLHACQVTFSAHIFSIEGTIIS